MTAQNPAIFLQAGSHPAEDVRRMLESLFTVAGTEGVVDAADMAVTENGTPNMSVNVAGGRAWIQGDEATYQGVYFVENRGVTNVTISASDPTNPRIDLIVAKVQDSGYSGGTDAWSLAAVTGTPAGSPSAPTAPDNSITLAQIDVAAAVSTIVDGDITDTRTVAATARSAGGLWTPYVTWVTEADTTSIPKTSTWTAVGSTQTITKPAGWTSFKVRVTGSGAFTVASGNDYELGIRVSIDGAQEPTPARHAHYGTIGTHGADMAVTTSAATTYTADVDIDIEMWNSTASDAAITMTGLTYDIQLVRVS